MKWGQALTLFFLISMPGPVFLVLPRIYSSNIENDGKAEKRVARSNIAPVCLAVSLNQGTAFRSEGCPLTGSFKYFGDERGVCGFNTSKTHEKKKRHVLDSGNCPSPDDYDT
jgi:hypothetical protein